MCRDGKGGNHSEITKYVKKQLNIQILQESFILLTTDKLMFTHILRKYSDIPVMCS